MKIQYGSRFGNYRWDAECDVPEQLVPVLLPFAALQLQQRSPSSTAEKAMAGYEKRPKGFERDSIGFTEELAKVLAKHMSTLSVETGVDEKGKPIVEELEATVTVVEYVPTAAESKFTEEKVIVKNHQDKDDLAEWALVNLKVEVLPATPTEDKEFLGKVREFKKAMLATM